LAHLSRINSGGSATKCCQDFQFSKVIRCLPVKTDGYRSVNSDYRSINNGYRFFEFELSFRAVSSGFRRFTAGLPIPLVGENRFTVGKVNPATGSFPPYTPPNPSSSERVEYPSPNEWLITSLRVVTGAQGQIKHAALHPGEAQGTGRQ